MDNEFKNEFLKLNESLNSNDVNIFLSQLEQCASKIDLMVKKIDSKKEKILLSEHQQSLLLQLNECSDSILSLHILVLLVFQMVQHQMLHASGKFVPQILSFLQKETNEQLYSAMKTSQDLVLQYVSLKDETAKEELKVKLDQSVLQCKQMLNEFIGKKISFTKNNN